MINNIRGMSVLCLYHFVKVRSSVLTDHLNYLKNTDLKRAFAHIYLNLISDLDIIRGSSGFSIDENPLGVTDLVGYSPALDKPGHF